MKRRAIVQITALAASVLAFMCTFAAAQTQWGPWIQTTWSQGGIYNSKCPYDDPNNPGARRPLGCTAASAVQILNYHRFPKQLSFSQPNDQYTSSVPIFDSDGYVIGWDNIDIDNDSMRYGFPSFSNLTTALASIGYSGSTEEIENLCFGVATKLHSDFGTNGTSATWPLSAYQDEFRYGYAETEHGNPWDDNNVRNAVIQNMKEGQPAQMFIWDSTKDWDDSPKHSVICDGYRDDGYFHINYGWGAISPTNIVEAWYNLPNCDSKYHFNAIYSVAHDISPYQGWNQYGADQKNTFRTKYPVPVTEPQRKWQHTIGLSSYSYGHIVVGTGGRIYAAANPNNQGQSYHPGIHIFDRHGTREAAVYATGSDYSISSLAQNQHGDIYFATAHGTYNTRDKTTVFRIAADDISTTIPIFEHNNPDPGWPDEAIKIDRDDNIYVIVNPYYTANGSKLYSLSRTGSKKWEYYLGAGVESYGSFVAIDESRDQVYLTYRNSSSKDNYLVALNRNTGAIKYTYTFSDKPTGVVYTSPTVGDDGTIYMGQYTKLYAFTPTLTKKWTEKDFYPAYVNNSIVVGANGTLYSAIGKMVGSVWHPGYLRAINPTNGNQKWELEIASESLGDTYVGLNGVILASYGGQNLAAVRDNGNSGQLLWDVPAGDNLAFGPGNAIYTVPSGSENSIYALAVGSRGDPDGLAMDFADNSPPTAPANPFPANNAANQSVSITLSWACSDPNGHALTYDVFVCRLQKDAEAIFFPVTTRTANASFQLGGLAQGAEYLWKVVASDGQTRTDGPTWSFTTINSDPGPGGGGDGGDTPTPIPTPSPVQSGADFKIKQVAVTPSKPKCKSSFTVWVQVENKGTAKGDAGHVSLTVDGKNFGAVKVGSLDKKKTKLVKLAGVKSIKGYSPITLTLKADCYNVTQETNESNNTATKTVSCK